MDGGSCDGGAGDDGAVDGGAVNGRVHELRAVEAEPGDAGMIRPDPATASPEPSSSRRRDSVPAEGLWISLSGSGSVLIDGQQVRFATKHAELILYLLALAGDDGLPRDEVIGALWPEVAPIDGRPRLRTALWQIRRSLGAHARRLERERGVVRFALDGVAVDLGAGKPVVGSTILVGWNFSMPATLRERVA